MKSFLLFAFLLFSVSILQAQDLITLKTGEAINGKVAEVGISEIKYYKANNLQGPVYVTSKADITQIVYANGTTDVFAASASPSTAAGQPNVIVVPQPAPQTIIVERTYRRPWTSYVYPVFTPHIDLGHHVNLGHGGHHGGRHH